MRYLTFDGALCLLLALITWKRSLKLQTNKTEKNFRTLNSVRTISRTFDTFAKKNYISSSSGSEVLLPVACLYFSFCLDNVKAVPVLLRKLTNCLLCFWFDLQQYHSRNTQVLSGNENFPAKEEQFLWVVESYRLDL